jgi:putative SOS response-associated peptidase YedK
MCGRYALGTSLTELEKRFDLETSQLKLGFEARYNVAPSQLNPVILLGEDGRNYLDVMQWGLIPSWSKEPKAQFSTINARAEGIESKPAYRKPFRSQRCLIPATGFFEWKKAEVPDTRAAKIPYFIHLRNGDEAHFPIFAMAGLYDIWRGPDGTELKTYTIITTAANELIRPLHERMTVILPHEFEQEWLNPEITQPEKLLAMLQPYPPEKMSLFRVSSQVNSPNNDTPALLERVN